MKMPFLATTRDIVFPPPPAGSVVQLMLTPLNHTYTLVPAALAGLALVFFGSRLTQFLFISLSAVVTFASFLLTLPTLLTALPHPAAFAVTLLLSLGAAALAARAALRAAPAVPALAFVAGALAPNLVADFSSAVALYPAAGPLAAAVAFGLVSARLSAFAPAHFAAASTSLIGARLATACALMLASVGWAPRESVACFCLAGIGYLSQVFFFAPKDEESNVHLPYSRIG